MIHILFVDDEQRVLDGLRRTLRPMRGRWEMSFSESATNALTCLSQQPFDVLVTDMQMPEFDGCALLHEVRRQYPRMSRIVLSGHSHAEAQVRASGLAHFYLAKPCGMDDLTAAIHNRLSGPI